MTLNNDLLIKELTKIFTLLRLPWPLVRQIISSNTIKFPWDNPHETLVLKHEFVKISVLDTRPKETQITVNIIV